jgi:hypothetical protein
MQAKYLAEIGKTPEAFEAETAALEAQVKDGTAA